MTLGNLTKDDVSPQFFKGRYNSSTKQNHRQITSKEWRPSDAKTKVSKVSKMDNPHVAVNRGRQYLAMDKSSAGVDDFISTTIHCDAIKDARTKDVVKHYCNNGFSEIYLKVNGLDTFCSASRLDVTYLEYKCKADVIFMFDERKIYIAAAQHDMVYLLAAIGQFVEKCRNEACLEPAIETTLRRFFKAGITACRAKIGELTFPEYLEKEGIDKTIELFKSVDLYSNFKKATNRTNEKMFRSVTREQMKMLDCSNGLINDPETQSFVLLQDFFDKMFPWIHQTILEKGLFGTFGQIKEA